MELRIVQLGGIYRGNGKNGIESAKPLLLLDFFNLLPGICRSDLGNVLQDIESIGLVPPVGLLVEVRQYVLRNQADPFRGQERLFPIDIPNFLVVNIRLGIHRLDVVHPEGQYIFVVNGVHNGIGVELIAKSLFRRAEGRVFAHSRVNGENRCTGKAEQMIFFEIPGNGLVHIPKLAAVAFIEDDHNTLVKYRMTGVFLDEGCQLLNGGNDDFCVVIFQLPLQHRR